MFRLLCVDSFEILDCWEGLRFLEQLQPLRARSGLPQSSGRLADGAKEIPRLRLMIQVLHDLSTKDLEIVAAWYV